MAANFGKCHIYRAVPFGAAIIAAVVTSLRWASDRVKEAHLGQLMRAVDPTEAAFILPFMIVIVSGALTSVVGVIGIIVANIASYGWLVLLYSILLSLVLYDFLGLLSLIGLGRRLQTLHSRLQADKENLERLERELKQHKSQPDKPPRKSPGRNGTQGGQSSM